MLWRIRAKFALQAYIPVHVHPFEMHRIDRILLCLKPVAWNFREDNLPESVLPGEGLPIRHERSRSRAKICPDQAGSSFDGIRLDMELIFEARRGGSSVVEGLFDTPSGFVEKPAVIIAPQTASLHETVRQVCSSVGALPVDES